MELLIATGNPGKVREYEEMLATLPVKLFGLRDIGLGDMDVEETGTTLEENARLKAQAYAQASGMIALADDSGLFVDALDGAPGVYSARYGGYDLTMADRRALLLSQLQAISVDARSARFRCVIAVANPTNGELQMAEGVCEGHIAQEEDNGGAGFGYDAIFIPAGYAQNFSHIPPAEKNRISHRGRAAQAAVPLLQKLMNHT